MDINELIFSDEAIDLIDNGTWVDDLPGAPGMELLVCGLQSQAAQDLLDKKHAAARMENGGEPITEEQHTRCLKEVLAEVVLKDWKGIDDGGKPVKYSQKLAAKWITTRNGKRFSNLVLHAAQRLDMQANKFAETIAKNS